MKKILMAVACLITGYNYSYSQQHTTDIKQPQVIQKGYYGIGSNADKLEQKTPATALTTSEVSRGYYTVGKNTAKLNSVPVVTVGGDKKSSATKGYYAIGDNYRKLTAPGNKLMDERTKNTGAENISD